MKKLFLFCSGLLLAAASAAAMTPLLYINGEKVDKAVSKITFDGDNVVLYIGDEVESHEMDLVAFEFDNSLGLVDALSVGKFRGFIGDTLVVEGVKSGVSVEIYDTNGRLVATDVAVDNKAEFDTSALKSGVYVLRAGRDCVKFVK